MEYSWENEVNRVLFFSRQRMTQEERSVNSCDIHCIMVFVVAKKLHCTMTEQISACQWNLMMEWNSNFCLKGDIETQFV